MIYHSPSRLMVNGFAAALLTLLGSDSASAQTTWYKYVGNPIVDVGRVGSWDGALVIPGRVLVDSAGYRMWYTGFAGTRDWHIGYASSPDGIHWKKYDGNPILKAGPNTWDITGAVHPYVIQRPTGLEMWYTGGDVVDKLRIGYAFSQDGLVWEKSEDINPILDGGVRGTWYSGRLARPSVIGPDSLGQYVMWYSGEDSSLTQLGMAYGSDSRTWTKLPDPILRPGPPNSWDELHVFYPRVLYNDGIYEMWFGGMTRAGMRTRRIGYATSLDGIHWTKHPGNPVLETGPFGAWDHDAVLTGDLHFDGQLYHMWYHAIDMNLEVGAGRIGYAVSPRGPGLDLGPSFLAPLEEAYRIGVEVDDPTELSFSAEIRSIDGQLVHRIGLFDDGEHGDREASDGFFANSWVPPVEKIYEVDIMLETGANLFVLDQAAAFTTVGPLRRESLEFLGDHLPNPGDSIFVRIAIRNHGSSAAARAVEASLSPADSCLATGRKIYAPLGDIPAGESRVASDPLALYIRPDCPAGMEARATLAISSRGTLFWTDDVVLNIRAPWWRSQWAYGLYALMLLGLSGGTFRYVETRRLQRRIRALEDEQALARERARISQDMHDDVGSRLTEIGILSELAKSHSVDPHRARADIQKIAEISREVTASMSEIIWAIGPDNDSLDDLVAYLRHYSSKYLEPTGISLRFDVPDNVPGLFLPAENRRNIFLAVKEALNNVVKHSRASGVEVVISFPPRGIEIVIADNGCGFDAGMASRFGAGLRNMEKRMVDIGGTFDATSDVGEGTRVTIRCLR